jgi:hypothetical protein
MNEIPEGGVALFGPWIGEFGWELMTWQAWCRRESKKFNKSYVVSFPDMKPLYEDFAEFIPHKHQGRALDWHRKENTDKVQFDMPPDITVQILPPKQYRTEGDFIQFGLPIDSYAYLLHARGIARGGKNYPPSKWAEIAKSLTGTVASIGSSFDYHIPGTVDMRDIPLNVLMDIMAGCDCVIGQSSGVMHLACLCGARTVVWGDSRSYFGETLRERYTNTWNPFKTNVTFLFDDKWNPSPNDIIRAANVEERMTKEPEQTTSIDNLFISKEIRNKLTQAVNSGKYMITISTLINGKLHHYYSRNEFPNTDMIPSLMHMMNDIKMKEFDSKERKAPQLVNIEDSLETGVDQWT